MLACGCEPKSPSAYVIHYEITKHRHGQKLDSCTKGKFLMKLQSAHNVKLQLLLVSFMALWLMALPSFAAFQVPKLKTRILDQANLIDAASEQQINQLLAGHEQASSNQVIVVTLKDLQGFSIEQAGAEMGRVWGVGQKEQGNGILLILAQAERKVRIEVGYGLVGVMPDALSATIIQEYILPRFKTGDFSGGLLIGTQAIVAAFRGEYIGGASEVPVVKVPSQEDEILRASSGSGFAVSSDGYVITNNHVIEDCQEVVVHTKENDIRMRIVTYDTQNDLALLKGDFTPTSVFPLSTNRPELLQDIYVAGYPFGKNISTSVKVTKGIISSLTGIGNNFSNIQIDAAIQSGNSGGPILDDMGNVVGVAVSKLDAKYMFENFGSIPENTNFGIKSSVVRSVLDSSSVDIPAASKSPISKSQLGKMITNGTYYISCWMTIAQIEKVRSKKVLFSELD